MDHHFTPAEESFRAELRTFLRQELGADYAGPIDPAAGDPDFPRDFIGKLRDRGWLVPAWPKEHGGLGLSIWEQVVYGEEVAYHGARPIAILCGVGWAGPTIMLHGTDAQRARHLGPIARGEMLWCQGFSEPNAGSDLASVSTSAVRDGDDYVVNGQKIWTSGAHEADWMILLARTDPTVPKHRGLSFLLLDMKTPGIDVRPLINMMNVHRFNEVFFDNVRIPHDCVVGGENQGWKVATATLDFERSMSSRAAEARRVLDQLVDHVRTRGAVDRRTHTALAGCALELQVARLLAYRHVDAQAKGRATATETSVAKVFGTETFKRLCVTGMEILGLAGQLRAGSKWVPLEGRIERQFLWQTPMTVAGGSSEVQRNIIARRGLGLPEG